MLKFLLIFLVVVLARVIWLSLKPKKLFLKPKDLRILPPPKVGVYVLPKSDPILDYYRARFREDKKKK